MNSTTTSNLNFDQILSSLQNAKLGSNGTYYADCPAEPDGLLSISQDLNGEIVFSCQLGCPEEEIRSKLLGLGNNGSTTASVDVTLPTPLSSSTDAGLPLDKLHQVLAKWLYIPQEDREIVDFMLAVYKSQEIPGDPLWGCIIDASGGGKTELLRALRKRKNTYFLSKLTENSLVSGYRNPDNPEKDPSLLLELNEKVLVIKDMSPLLSMRRESRNEILGDLRDAYDGFSDQGHGNVGKVKYEARFTVLAASTLAIDSFSKIEQELGERFIRFRARGSDSQEKVRKAMRNIGADMSMREEIETAIGDFLDSLSPIGIALPEAMQEKLTALADFTARTRSHVARDRNGDLKYLPRPEVGTRLVKELGKLLLALAVVRGKTEPDQEDFAAVRRVAEDCLPPNRLAIIYALQDNKGPLRPSEIARRSKLARSTVEKALDDLQLLGVVEQTGKETTWKLVTPCPLEGCE